MLVYLASAMYPQMMDKGAARAPITQTQCFFKLGNRVRRARFAPLVNRSVNGLLGGSRSRSTRGVHVRCEAGGNGTSQEENRLRRSGEGWKEIEGVRE